MEKIESYKLTNEADIDLENIFDYTEKRYDINQAIDYLSGLEDIFFRLCEYPNLGRVRNDIKQDLFSFPLGEYVIFMK